MCGIAGLVSLRDGVPINVAALRAMNESQIHRGPDDEGLVDLGGAGLAMRRLSIIDLESGHQPITNENETITIVCNGEIYNYVEVRRKLLSRGHAFTTNSDIETIVHLYEEHDLAFVSELNGMFAFALWDDTKRRMILARDRIGKKPLHFWVGADLLAFGSEIKTLLANPQVPREPDLASLQLLLKYNYVPGPLTAWQGIRELPPGCLAVIQNGRVDITSYWRMCTPRRRLVSVSQARAELEPLLRDAIRIRLRSDVPVGVFLSGGIDSSLVASLAAEQHRGPPLQSFAITFPDSQFDESEYARRAANHIGTHHREIPMDASDLVALYRRVVTALDEPFGDTSFLPTWVLSEFAAQHVKVVLTGDGGDEMFAGYQYYLDLDREAHRSGGIRSPWHVFDDDALHRLLTPDAWPEAALDPIDQLLSLVEGASEIERALWFDRHSLLADNNVVKPDRMGMAHSLEARSPLLDYRIAEWSAALSANVHLAGGESKHILRSIAAPRFDTGFFDRPKGQFTVPFGEWIRGPLAQTASELILGLADRGLCQAAELNGLLHEHSSGRRNRTRELRLLFVLALWFDEIAGVAAPA